MNVLSKYISQIKDHRIRLYSRLDINEHYIEI